MFQVENYSGDKSKDYQLLIKQLDALITGETDEIVILANSSALLNQFLDNVNWVGFYLWKNDQLILGPFQGLPACTTIAIGKGVCGTAAAERKTQLVANVEAFPGHIACDAASKSEIVIPIIMDDKIYGVLDIDSPIYDRFDEIDQKYLEEFIEHLKTFLK
ncbi:GAF domain-containing protein [Ornithinibacillus sp. 4-3]|uniref:GAF domain-containing protein n=1 Tax=Ornithinibacillus sp. 4-3 TaxID=3231488 RepID=A0AB39HP88_9BACI